MSKLTIQDIEPEILTKLTILAQQHQRSVEEEHRAILREALLKRDDSRFQPSFATFLASIPNVGIDSDFERGLDSIREVDLGE